MKKFLRETVLWILAVSMAIPVIYYGPGLVGVTPFVQQVQATMPTFVNAGASTPTCGAASVTPTMPSNVLTNDILLLFAETANQTITVSGGTETWTQTADSPQGTGTAGSTAATRLTAFWARASQDAPTSPATNDSGNHQCAAIIAVRGVVTSGDPWDVTSGGVSTTGPNNLSITGDTTTGNDRFIVAAVADDWDDASSTRYTNWTDSSLANITERVDGGTAVQNGGGLAIMTAEKASAGTYGSITVDQNASILVDGFMTIALKPPAVTDQNAYRWRNDDGSESAASWKNSENATISDVSLSEIFRVRFEIEETVGTATTVNAELQYSSDATSCTDGSWTTLDTSSTAWRVTASTNITNGDATTNQLTSSGLTFDAGRIFDTQNQDATGVTLGDGASPGTEQSEWEWAIRGDGAANSTTYRFRVTDAGSTLNTYTNCAQLTTVAPAGPTTDQVMRHGNWFSSGTEQSFFWAN